MEKKSSLAVSWALCGISGVVLGLGKDTEVKRMNSYVLSAFSVPRTVLGPRVIMVSCVPTTAWRRQS